MMRLRNTRLAFIQIVSLRALSIALNVGTGVMTAAALGPHGRGELAALMLAPQVLPAIATLGLHASLIYNVKEDSEREAEYLAANVLLTFSAGLAAVALGWLIEPLWLVQYGDNIMELGRWFLLITPLTTTSWAFTAALEARERFVLANRPACLQPLVTLAILVFLSVSKQLTPLSAGVAYSLPTAVSFTYLAVIASRQIRSRFTMTA